MINDCTANKQFNCWELGNKCCGRERIYFKWNYYKPYEIFLSKNIYSIIYKISIEFPK